MRWGVNGREIVISRRVMNAKSHVLHHTHTRSHTHATPLVPIKRRCAAVSWPNTTHNQQQQTRHLATSSYCEHDRMSCLHTIVIACLLISALDSVDAYALPPFEIRSAPGSLSVSPEESASPERIFGLCIRIIFVVINFINKFIIKYKTLLV